MGRLTQIHDQIASGDFFFIQGNSWYARLIRWNTASRFTHVGIAVWISFGKDDRKRLCIFEAINGQGVRLYPMDRYLGLCKKAREKVFWYRTDSSINREAIVAFVSLHWGKRYATTWQMVYSFGWGTQIFKKIFGWSDKDLNKDGFFCSELGAGALLFAGVKTKLPASQSPGDLAESVWLHNQGEVIL